MKIKCWIVMSLVGVGFSAGSLGADTDLAVTNFWKNPFASALYTYVGEASLNPAGMDNDVSDIEIHEVTFGGSLPIWRKGPHLLLAGVSANWDHFKFNNVGVEDKNVYAVKIPFDYHYDGLGDWAMWGNLSPGVISDFEHMSSDDYKTQGHGLLVYRWRPWLNLAAGAAYDSALGDDDVYPLGGVIWRLADQWQLNALLPQPSLLWRPEDRLVLFLDARPAGDKWNVHAENSKESLDFKMKTWRVGTGVEYRLAGMLWLHLAGGIVLDRHYEIGRDSETFLDADADNAWFVRTGVTLR